MEKEKKKTIILSVVAITTLALLVVGATYAYFTSQGGDPASADVSVTTYTTDVLTFSAGDNISIYADQSSFASGKGNATGSTYAKAMLTANNKTNTATEHYYVYLNITNNEFIYTIDENTPELILTVTDSSGNEITDISGLTHVSVIDGKGETVSGYDITETSGLLTLFNNREITASPSKEEQWNIKLTFVNYEADQNENAGYNFAAKVIIQKEYKTISDVCTNGSNLASCIKTLANKGNVENTKIYHHDGSLENGISDGSYRYAGASVSVNNYVCFGSSEAICPMKYLYRIIGVFGNQVKLIKYDYATRDLLGTDGTWSGARIITSSDQNYKGELTKIDTYDWAHSASAGNNTWSESVLNTLNLNTNFITNIGEEWADKIATTTWKVGGNTEANIKSVVPAVAYQNEIVNPEPTSTSSTGETEYSAKIGLMYVSDYGFAAEPSAWTTTLSNYKDSTVESVNWMWMNFNDWTITRETSKNYMVFGLASKNYISGSDVKNYVRPVFFLESSVAYASGDGTLENPIRLGD